MILQIQYKGNLLLSVELPPDVRDMEQLKFKLLGKGELPNNEVKEPEIPPVKEKAYIKDIPRINLPEKESIKFKRAKAVYSNKNHYDV